MIKSEEYTTRDIKGIIRRRVFDLSGKLVNELVTKNIVTYTATNLLARAISGDNTARISHIRIGGMLTSDYAAADGANTTYFRQTPSRQDTTMYYAGNPHPAKDTVITVPAVFLRFDSEETEELDPVQQDGNVVFYQATLDYATGNGYTFDEMGMYGDTNTAIFSHAKVDPIGKTSSFQIDYTWSLIFR